MENVLKLVWVGDVFYEESGTMMSSIYDENGGRSDWGKVNVHLREGGSVQIRQPTTLEIDVRIKELLRRKKDRPN